jgi:phosphate:Na+ symporter
MILIWFVPVIEKIVTWMVPSPKGEEEVFRLKYIGSGLLSTAELSLNEAKQEVVHFGEICYKGFGYIRQAVNEQDAEKFEQINDKLIKYESITDNIEYEIAQYLGEISKGELSSASTRRVKSIYKIIGEMESLGDSGEALGRMLRRVHEHGKKFDKEMLWKLNRLMDYVEEAYKAMLDNLHIGYRDLTDISNASNAEYNINSYRNSLREELINNIEHDQYQYLMGVFYMDVVNELEKIGDFIINISQALIQEKNEN